MRLARRMQFLGTETAFEVLAQARDLERQGRDIVHMEIGEPDCETPEHVTEAAAQALRDGYTHYGPSPGFPELREEVALYVSRTRGIAVDPARVVVTPGAKPILFYTILALAQRGDEVIYPDPGFPIYESMIRFCGARPVPLRFRQEGDVFRLDLEDLASKVSSRTRLVILNFPHNPTGATLSGDQVEDLADLLRASNAVVLSDEVYSEILYDQRHLSIAALPGFADRTVLVDGFSKTYAMTGWRLGYGVFPEPLVPHVVKLIVNSVSCPASFSQQAALQALRGPQGPVQRMVAGFREKRDALVEGLRRIPGLTCCVPGGAFYAFPDIAALGVYSDEFAHRALDEAGVALLSGRSFGHHGEGFIRLSYATSVENIHKALERLEVLIRGLKP